METSFPVPSVGGRLNLVLRYKEKVSHPSIIILTFGNKLTIHHSELNVNSDFDTSLSSEMKKVCVFFEILLRALLIRRRRLPRQVIRVKLKLARPRGSAT